MKRDMDLVRKIAFALEEHEHGYAPSLKLDGYTDEQIGHHVYLMMQEKLVEADDATHGGHASPVAEARSLTWKGHEFIQLARSDTLWNKAKATVREKTGGLVFGVLFEYLKQQAKTVLGL